MKQNFLHFLVLTALIPICTAAYAQGKQIAVEPAQEAQIENPIPVQINELSARPLFKKASLAAKQAKPQNIISKKTDAKEININVPDATLTNRLTAGYWTIDGQTVDKNNSFMLYFISKGLQGTFTDVEDFYDYNTYVTDKSSGSNVYYENLSAVNITSAVIGDSLVIEGTMSLSDSNGNPANVTLHVTTPFTQTWGEWADFAPFEMNTGKYIFSIVYTNPKTLRGIPVQVRKDNTGLTQYKFVGWGKRYLTTDGIDLIVNMNPDYTCTVPEQSTGYFQKNYNEYMMVQDFASKTGQDIPSTYDPETGVFELALSYYVSVGSFGNAYETMTMDKPILERDTVDIVSTKLCYIDYIARGNDAVTYYAEDIPGYSSFHLTSMNATSIDGTFRWSEGNIDDLLSYFTTNKTGNNYFQDGEFNVLTEGRTIILTGWMIGEDEKYYRLNMSYIVPAVHDTLYYSGDNFVIDKVTHLRTGEQTGWFYDMYDLSTGYQFLLQSNVIENKFGTFSYEDGTLGNEYYNVYDAEGNVQQFVEGSATVAEVGDSIVLDGEFIAEDEKVYILHFAIAHNTLLTAGEYEITATITANEGIEVPEELQKFLGGYTAHVELTGDSIVIFVSTTEEGFILNGFTLMGDAVMLNEAVEVMYGDRIFQLGDAAGNTTGKLAITKTGENEYALADGTIVYMGNVVGTVTGITFKMIEDPTTGINSVDTKAVKSGKLLENGKLVIIKNGVKYGVTGQVM